MSDMDIQVPDEADEHRRRDAFDRESKTPEGKRVITFAFIKWVLAAIGRDTRVFVEHKIKALETRIAELEARPTPEYKGTWNEHSVYGPGAMTTHRGAIWYAKLATVGQRPGTVPDVWVLACKSGRDGRDGRDGKDATR